MLDLGAVPEDTEVLLVVVAVDLGPPLEVLFPGGEELEVDLHKKTYFLRNLNFIYAGVMINIFL